MVSELVRTQIEFVRDIGKLIEHSSKLGLGLTAGEAYRTKSQQLLYYFGNTVIVDSKQKLKIIGDKKRSWTTKSKHLQRLAMDFNLFVNGQLSYRFEDYKPLGVYWESLNPKNRWGGFWKTQDCPHFQREV